MLCVGILFLKVQNDPPMEVRKQVWMKLKISSEKVRVVG